MCVCVCLCVCVCVCVYIYNTCIHIAAGVPNGADDAVTGGASSDVGKGVGLGEGGTKAMWLSWGDGLFIGRSVCKIIPMYTYKDTYKDASKDTYKDT